MNRVFRLPPAVIAYPYCATRIAGVAEIGAEESG